MLRHSSAEQTRRRPLERGSADRRSSVVDWLNGLTDNNPKPDTWALRSHDERLTRNGSVISVDEVAPDELTQRKDLLLNNLKREVKRVMEDSVVRKNADLNSPYVTSLCAAVDACLMDGLRKRLLGLFGCRSSLALLHSLAKQNATAESVLARTLVNQQRANQTQHLVWIREALHMRALSTICHYISSSKTVRRLYDNNALMLDRAKGGMVAALLMGPCAVPFKRMCELNGAVETTAEELVERGTRPPISPNPSRPPLSITRQGSSIVSSVERGSVSRDYVYSLHHNFKSSLLYGKNNVAVAVNGDKESVKGYLSLHKNIDGNLTLKWTPNQLMHASSQPSSAHSKENDNAGMWKHAIHIEMQDIIYIHLHQRDDQSPACLTFVNCEGVQSAPLQLPAGQHSVAFLTSLETGLTPILRLDPPLWTGQSKEKILPRLRKRSTAKGPTSSSVMLDYVFRLVRTSGVEPSPEEEEPGSEAPSPTPPIHNNCVSLPNSPYIVDNNVENLVNLQIGKACQSMRNQILARAFYGWFSYVRHLRTVRKHLLYLVNTREMDGEDDAQPVDEIFWAKCRSECTADLEREFLQRVYWRGIEGVNPKELRRQAWPYLLGLYAWDEGPEPKTSEFTKKYREEVDEWKILEAEVRKRDEEAFIAARQKRASPLRECSMMSDVFEDSEEPTCSSEHLISHFATNLHRIDKDVERCDRNLIFFSNKENLESLRRVMCTYVRRNLDEGYIQGMCDLLAPLLVVFEDEALALECFTIVMGRLRENFPQRSGMDQCLSNLRSLIQVVDPQIFALLTETSDFTHLYFSYRWFLLDFKRELSYECTYKVWETIWAAGRTVTPQFALFFALAMVTNYRDVIVTNNMDFTDMIKFFNEMAERHDCARLLQAARNHVKCLQNLVQQLR